MRRFSVSTLLVAVFAALVIPLVTFFIVLIAQLQHNEKVSLERRTLGDAIAVSRSMEPFLREMSVVLNLMTSSEALQRGALEAFHTRAQRELEGTGNFVVLVGERGQQLVNTRVDYTQRLGQIIDYAGFQQVLASGEERISNVLVGGVSSQWVFNLMKPLVIEENPKVKAALITRNAIDLRRIFELLTLPPRWQSVIIDGNGRVVTAKDETAAKIGERVKLPNNISPEVFTRTTGFMTVDMANRSDQIIGYSQVRGTDWFSIVYGPVSSAQRSILITWYWLFIGGTIFLVLAITVLYFFANSFIRSMRKIAGMARQVGEGELVAPINTRIAELDLVAKTLSEASFDRSQKEDTIRVVMQELSHRTKNLIAVVISMVRQTAKRSNSPQAMVATITERIMGLGHSIDLLTAKDWGAVPLYELIEKQFSNFGIIGKSVKLDGPKIHLRPEAVQHLGMALHELVTNAVKYGALSVPAGRVDVTWDVTRRDDQEFLSIKWVESGGPPAEEPEEKGFGTQILDRHVGTAFVGKTELHYGKDGFRWSITGPLEKFCARKGDLARNELPRF